MRMGWSLNTSSLRFSSFKSRGVLAADFVSDAARLGFQLADGEIRASLAIEKILRDPLLETPAAFALGDMDEIMDNKFAIGPGIGPNDERVSKPDAARIPCDNASASRGRGQAGMSRQRDAIDDKNTHLRPILNSSPARVIGVTCV
jgi:hypothetical protein